MYEIFLREYYFTTKNFRRIFRTGNDAVVMTQWLARETSDRSLGWLHRHCTAYRASSSQEHFRDLPWQVSNDSFLLQYHYGVPVSHVGRLPATHQLFPNRCCPYIFVHEVASNTTSYLLLTAASHLDLSI